MKIENSKRIRPVIILKFVYVILAVAWTQFCLGLSGEAAIAPFLITLALTAPVGILLVVISILSELIAYFFVPIALLLNYFQWILLARTFRKLKTRFRAKVE